MLGTLYWSAPPLGALELDNDDRLWSFILDLCVSISLFCLPAYLSAKKIWITFRLITILVSVVLSIFFSPSILMIYISLFIWESFNNGDFDKYLSLSVNISVERIVFSFYFFLNIVLYLVPSCCSCCSPDKVLIHRLSSHKARVFKAPDSFYGSIRQTTRSPFHVP